MTGRDWADLFVAAVTAAALTFLEIDRKFRFPDAIKRKRLLYSWLWSFVAGNALLAALLFPLAIQVSWINQLPTLFRGLLVGVGYLSIARQKFITAAPKEKSDAEGSPVGIEYIYEAVKGAVHRHINEISIKERSAAVKAEISATALRDLVLQARIRIQNDNLLSPQERTEALEWLTRVAGEASPDDQKAATVATYVLFGDR